jgi:nucleoside-diphosphate-sugar epimerase
VREGEDDRSGQRFFSRSGEGGDPGMKVLVTGGTGFIGSHVIDELVRVANVEVHALGPRADRERRPEVVWHHADLLRDGASMRDVVSGVRATHLIHTAWVATPGTYQTDLVNYEWVAATIELALAFIEAGGQRFVGAGTCAEYDLRHPWMTEAITPLAPSTPYAVAKDATRRVIESLCAAAQAGFAWGRIFSPYGPRENPSRLTGSVVRSLIAGQTAAVSAGLQVRDFLHVRDVASALVHLARSDVRGAVNICSGQPRTVREFVGLLAAAVGGPGVVAYGERPLHSWEPPEIVGDNALLRSTGWTPEFDVESGIVDTVAWWRSAAEASS